MPSIPPLFLAPLMLALSNVFMNYAWYGHLRSLNSKPLWIAIAASWGVALFEYMVMVPANRIGHGAGYSLGELKMMQEIITLIVFAVMSLGLWDERLKLDHLWAALCLLGAVYFVFRSRM